jgi:hypothetical protein
LLVRARFLDRKLFEPFVHECDGGAVGEDIPEFGSGVLSELADLPGEGDSWGATHSKVDDVSHEPDF